MRYYRYGGVPSKHELEAKDHRRRDVSNRFGELIIDDDTIYEIDKDCLKCKAEKERRK